MHIVIKKKHMMSLSNFITYKYHNFLIQTILLFFHGNKHTKLIENFLESDTCHSFGTLFC